MLCDGKHKYVRNLIEGETEELYHMDADQNELVNLAHDPVNDSMLKSFRQATITELRRTDAGMVENLPSVGTESIRSKKQKRK